MSKIELKYDKSYIWEIFKKLESHEYAIPVFKRDFVWSQQRIIDLFDSIWNGYPIGTVILWAPDTIIPSKDILTDKEQKDVNSPMYFILDGRQRLTAIYGCVQSEVKNEKFDLYFNLDTEKFTYDGEGNNVCMKVSDIYDTFILQDRLQEITVSFEEKKAKIFVDRARLLNSILQAYTVSVIIIKNCLIDQAKTVYSRINQYN